jgi:hypothetical protein
VTLATASLGIIGGPAVTPETAIVSSAAGKQERAISVQHAKSDYRFDRTRCGTASRGQLTISSPAGNDV